MQYVRSHIKRTRSRRQIVVDSPEDLSPWEITVWTDLLHTKLSWRDKIYHFIHSEPVHYTILALLLVDVFTVILAIALEIEILSSEVHECESVVDTCQEIIHDSSSSSSMVYAASSSSECVLETSHHVENLEYIEHSFAYLSISILSLFALENLTLLFAKPKKFVTSPMQMLDLFVIVLSLILEILFKHVPEGGLLIIARSWRFARISHGIYESREDEHLEKLAEIISKADDTGVLTSAYHSLKGDTVDDNENSVVGPDGRHKKVLDPAVTKLLIEAVGLYLTGHDPIAAEKQRKFEAKALAQAEAANNGGINSDASRGLGHLLVPTPSHRFTSLSDPALDENSGLMTEEEEKRQL